MDSIILTNSGAPLITPWSARGMSDEKFAALETKDARKKEIDGDAMKAFDTPAMKASEKDKSFIKQIQGIRDRLKILRKLFAGNPKEMAKAMAQVFKELKQALKEYKSVTDKEIGVSLDAVSEVMTPPTTAMDSKTDTDKTSDDPGDDVKTDGAQSDDVKNDDTQAGDTKDATTGADAKSDDSAKLDAPSGDANALDKTSLYSQVEQKVVQMAGNDGLGFVAEIKGLVNFIDEKMLTPARIQMKAQKSDKETDKAFEDAEKQLKELRQQMEDMERDIKREAPSAGQTVDIAA